MVRREIPRAQVADGGFDSLAVFALSSHRGADELFHVRLGVQLRPR
jgi:hypothetical protein